MTESHRWFGLALVLLAGWLLHSLAPIITPFAVSAGLAYLGDPLVDRFEKLHFFRWRVNRTVAVTLVFILISMVLTLILLIIVPLLIRQLQELIQRAPEVAEWLVGTAVPWVEARLGFNIVTVEPEVLFETARNYWKEAGTAVLGVLGTVSRSGQAAIHWVLNLVLIPVVTFYLLRDWDKLIDGIRRLLPRALEPTVAQIAHEIDEVLGAFIRGQLLVMTGLGLIYAIGLWAVGLDLAFVIGMGAGLLSIVPYLGTFVGVLAAVIAVLFQFGDLWHLLLVLAVFGVGQSAESMFLTPLLVGDRIGLHPVTVIFAVLAGGQLFGFLGILLALPVAAALNVLVRHLNDRYRASHLYTRAPAGRPDADPPAESGSGEAP
ncbi:MAG: AI-2E family transporter [Xanthomonadales bacterium]|nr:AI-2E family transporter [Gammaproteobacteria bacterium]MBT8050545.1 AI-2E family transporter [Gammaproteobacteria bacterium]NNL04362.1 AI-2E family transporter [Xanthomonadales bacterium]